ncbi:odorant receptor 94a-like [Eurosta solidaginis]|uniref:odorant receptor 94a-like n=1 Tax=Eurosta solidaginis TaxID=178769 RepID=UPI0035308932
MSLDEIGNYRLLIRTLRFLGAWPVANGTNTSLARCSYRCFQILLQFTFTFIITFLLWLNAIWSSNFDKAMGVLKYAVSGIVLNVKVLNTTYYAPMASELLHEFEISTALAPETNTEQELWCRAQRVYRRVIIIYLIASNSVLAIAFLAFFFVEPRQLPVDIWIPDALRKYSLWPAYIYEVVAGPFSCVCNMCMDLFQCYLLLHLTLYLKLIGLRLERLSESEENDETTKRLVKLIIMHRQVKRMIKCCEEIISVPVLTQITLSSLIICFTIYNLQNKSFAENPIDFLATMIYTCIMSLQILLPCYYANGITAQAERLSHQLYSCNWIDMSPYNRRLIFLFMRYLQQPIVLQAGNYFQIGLPIFTKTMNNAYTLLALILNVSKDGGSSCFN